MTQARTAKRPVYLDYQATTPTDARVVEAMLPYFSEKFGNPHSVSHFFGWEAEEAVEIARAQVAHLIGAEAEEIVFTSGATESNNLAVKGVARAYKAKKNHIVTCATEHMCVLDSAFDLEKEGFSVTYLPVARDGLIDLDALEAAVTDKTVLVSIMAVQNEIGVIQPLAEIGAIAREKGAFFHTDAAQAAGKIPLDVAAMNIDLLSISGHKIYGPMGIGALFVRRRPRIRVEPLFSGGGQERDLRSGTVPAPLAVGLGAACEIADREMAAEAERLRALRGRFLDAVLAGLDGVTVNGSLEHRIPGNLNISIAGVAAETLMAGLSDLALSSGSACTSASRDPSHVLSALGIGKEAAESSLRIGFGRLTTEDEVDYAARRVIEEVGRQRAIQDGAHARASAPEQAAKANH